MMVVGGRRAHRYRQRMTNYFMPPRLSRPTRLWRWDQTRDPSTDLLAVDDAWDLDGLRGRSDLVQCILESCSCRAAGFVVFLSSSSSSSSSEAASTRSAFQEPRARWDATLSSHASAHVGLVVDEGDLEGG